MHDNSFPTPASAGDDIPVPADARTLLHVALLTDDPATARALLTACERLPSFDARVRLGALHENLELAPRPDEIVIYDPANARDRRFDPAQHPRTACVAVAYDLRDLETAPCGGALFFADLGPTTLETAIRLSLRWRDRGAAAEAATLAADRARIASVRMIDDLIPMSHALEGLIELMRDDAAAASEAHRSNLRLVDGWAKDLSRALERRRFELAGEESERTDLVGLVVEALPLFHKKATARRQTLLSSAPPAPLMARVAREPLRAAFCALVQSVIEREGKDRRIEIVLWPSLDECRLAVIAGPATRGAGQTTVHGASGHVHEAGDADAAFMAALENFRTLGASVDIATACATGATMMIALPAAG